MLDWIFDLDFAKSKSKAALKGERKKRQEGRQEGKKCTTVLEYAWRVRLEVGVCLPMLTRWKTSRSLCGLCLRAT